MKHCENGCFCFRNAKVGGSTPLIGTIKKANKINIIISCYRDPLRVGAI